MRLFRRADGAISVFLAIILVPIMTISAIFVDASKVQLGRALAESAGDLALNTALTNYDTELKDLYGLMATAQDTSDLFMKLEDYYTTCITSAGVSEEDSIYYVGQIMSSLGMVSDSSDVSDIMNMEVVDFTVNKRDDASLANASIMKKQIVDFMKYRAPINTGLSFVSSLKSFSTLKQQNKLIEEKQDYYKKQQTVLEDLQEAWSFIAKYNATDVAKVDGYVKTVSENMEIFRNGGKIGNESYLGYNTHTSASRPEGLNYLLVWDLYDTKVHLGYSYTVQNTTVSYEAPNAALDENDYPIILMGGTRVDEFSYYCDRYNSGAPALPTVDDFQNQLSNFYAIKSDVNELWDAINEKIDWDVSKEHRLRFYVNAMRGNEGVDDYSNKVVSLYLSYQKLKAMEIWVEEHDNIKVKDANGNDVPASPTSQEILSTVIELDDSSHNSDKKAIRKWCQEAESDLENVMNHFRPISESFNDHATAAEEIYNTSYNDATLELSDISTLAKEYQKQFKTASESLTSAIEKLGNAKTKLEGEVATAKTEWQNAADNSAIKDTSLAKQDQAEIDQLDKYLNSDNIDKLIKRLTNVRDKVKAGLEEIEKYKVGGSFIGEISTVEILCEKYGSIRRTEFLKLTAEMSDLNGHTGSWIVQNCEKGKIEYDWVGTPSHQPNLNLDKPSLYTYLYSHFAKSEAEQTSVKTEKKADGEDFYNDIKDKTKSETKAQTDSLTVVPASENSDKDKENGKDKPTEISKMTNLPSKNPNITNTKETPTANNAEVDAEKGASSAASSLGSLLEEDFLKAVAGFGEDLRDKLYISEYVMSMFSYGTMENEYIREQKEKGKTVDEVNEGDIKSLTLEPISATNNYAYGNEIEYILHGGSYAGNSAKVYASIYGIRLGFNLVYAFATSEIRDSALAIATPISAATLGVIPVPLIQAVIIVGIACCESGIDLTALSQGYKIPLYKTQETWRSSITGITKLARGVVEDSAKKVFKDVSEAVIDESVNKLNEFLDATSEEIDANIETYAVKANQAITGVFDDVITENAQVAIQQLTTYINTAVENTLCFPVIERDRRKREMKNWVKNEMSAWGEQFTGDDLVSMVKREAVKAIVSNSDKCIDQLFELVNQSITSGASSTDIDAILNGATDATSDTMAQLGGVVMKQIDAIRREISDTLDDSASAVAKYKDQVFADISSSIDNGAEDLKETVNAHIDEMFGSGTGSIGNENGNATGAAAFFSYSYKDYLRLFLIIGTFANEEKVLLRTADVVQVNMAKCRTDNDGYLLSNSAAYVNINAKIQVKPTLIGLPLFSSLEKNPIDNTKWYTIDYEDVAGY